MRLGLQIGLLLSLAFLMATTWPAWGGGDAQVLENIGIILGYTGLAASAGLSFWQPARATGWHTASAILAVTGLAVAMLMQPLETDEIIVYTQGVVLYAVALLVGFVMVDRSTHEAQA